MRIERITFKNKAGFELSARLYSPLDEQPRFFALFAHCFTCSKNFSAVNNISNTLCSLGVAVMSFDFTGLGNSEGEFEDTDFSSNVGDLLSASQFLEENHIAPALLIGHSLGGAAVIFAASKLSSVKAVVTIGAPADPQHVKHLFESDLEEIKKSGSALVNIGGRSFKVKKDFIDDLEKRNLQVLLAEMRKSFLFLHSPQDSIVDITNAATLYEAAHHPKSFISLDGADHLLTNKADITNPDLKLLVKSWNKKIPEIEKIQKRFDKPVLFTEIGYCNTEDAVVEPWVWPNERKSVALSEEVQALCYQAFFETVWQKPWFAGAYFWKWYPQPRDREPDFTPQNKMAQKVMKNNYTADY